MDQKKTILLLINLFFLITLFSGASPSCGSSEREDTKHFSQCENKYAGLKESPDWSILATNDQNGLEIWKGPETMNLILVSVPEEFMSHKEAKKYCENLKFDTWQGSFRLPLKAEMEELQNTFGFENLPVFVWSTCYSHGFRKSAFWVEEKHLAIDAIDLSPFAVPYPVNAGESFTIYEADEYDKKTSYMGENRPSLDGDASVLCVGDLTL